MSDMICSRCGQTGIRWMGSFNNFTHTECPHCGGRNCQEIPVEIEAEDCEDCPPAHYPTDETRCAECPKRETQ